MQQNPCGKCCVGNVIYNEKIGKTIRRGTMDAEINIVIYMELYSGANMVDDKYLKTNNVRSIEIPL
jgi:Na+-transporting methylmalonyl-CoA/oxaloacetate decarboxylase beta subunit